MADHFLSRDKLLPRHPKNFFWAIVLLIIILLIDLAFINYKILFDNRIEKKSSVQKEGGKIVIASESSSLDQGEYICDKNCQEQIDKLVSQAVSEKAQESDSSSTSVSAPASVKEFYIPFGSGTINSTTWKNVTGLEANIDGDAYGNIQKATFEVTVSVPTGNENVELQLFNSTKKHPVWFSPVTFTGGSTSQLLVSNPITLDSGNNLYVVQAKTQLQFPANIDQARVHIITN